MVGRGAGLTPTYLRSVGPKSRPQDPSEARYKLPNFIKVTSVESGEVPYMKRKTISNAIRFHKIKEKNSHEWIYSQLLLYRPFQQEMVDLKEARDNKDICMDMFLYPANPDLIKDNEQ